MSLYELSCALKKCEYTRVNKIMTEIFPIEMNNLVIHSLFRMKLIEMRHNVFRRWSFCNHPYYPIPIEYATKVLMYDDENECIEDIRSCRMEIKE